MSQSEVSVQSEALAIPRLRDLLSLAWPIVISRSCQVIVGVSDAVLVAHLGDAAIAATTAGAGNAFVVMILPIGTVFIVSSFAAQLTGRGDGASARRYAWYGLVIAVLAQLLCLGTALTFPAWLGYLPYSPDVRALMGSYLTFRLLSGGAAVGLEALANYYGGTGDTVRPMVASVSAMVLNVALNVALIDGRFGFPAMGVAGSGLASTIATVVAFLGLFGHFVWRGWAERRTFGASPGSSWGRKLHEFWRMLRFGLPSGFNWFFEFLAFQVFVNLIVAHLGTMKFAAMMIVLQLNSVSFMPAFGIASAGAILVGQAIGEGARADVSSSDRVWGAVRLTLFTNMLWQSLVGCSYLIVPALLLTPFVGADGTGLAATARAMLMLSAAWQLFDAVATTFAEALRAAGDTAFTLWARCAIAWVLFVPGAWLSVRVLGGNELVAVAWLVGYMCLLAVVLVLRYRSGVWRSLRLVEPSATGLLSTPPP